MSLTDVKTFKYKQVWLIVIGLIALAILAGGFGTKYHFKALDQLRNSHLEIKKANDERIASDSIIILNLRQEREIEKKFSDSLIIEVKNFKNQSFINYNKWQDAQNTNYNNSSELERNKLFTDKALEK